MMAGCSADGQKNPRFPYMLLVGLVAGMDSKAGLRWPSLPSQVEHPAGNLKSKFARNGELRSGFNPIGPVLFEDVEDDGAEMSAKRADSLVVFLALSTFFLVVAL